MMRGNENDFLLSVMQLIMIVREGMFGFLLDAKTPVKVVVSDFFFILLMYGGN